MAEKDLILPGRRRILLSQRPHLMAILNMAPDSFYDGGVVNGVPDAIQRVEQMLEDGADIIDVGGESTRPGALPVPLDEEIQRVVPVVEALRSHWRVPISIDTYKAEVAKRALDAGADIINDVSGLRFDPAMIKVAKETTAPLVVMHMLGSPRDMQKNPQYSDVVAEVRAFFEERYRALVDAGINPSRIIFDPGIGFGKKLEHNLALLADLDELVVENRPLLVGASRKSFIGALLDVPDPALRLNGSIAVTALAVFLGASI
ncbi:MAG TPA: dihydropteroate synthase, partial [Planctomycetes bacterium]|nr:dihydropteroate synthase [Planctomycetota bacterium]